MARDRWVARLDADPYPVPTEEELKTLRKVSDSIPWVCWLFCFVEFSERASYYGAQTVFSNFMEYPLPVDGNGAGAPPKGSEETAGALGKGLQFANAFVLLFQFLAYVVPIFGAWVADTKLGRFKTIVIGVLVCFVAHIIMTLGALPSVLKAGRGIAPFIISLFILAIGAGIFKPNVAPTLLDQYTHQKPYTRIEKSGEKVIVDPEATIQRLMLIFYALINVGAFFALATTYSEKLVGYWLAFLLPTIMFMLLPVLLAFLYSRTVRVPPSGSELTRVVKIASLATKENKGRFWKKGFWDAAKPSKLAAKGITTLRGKPIDWNDKFVDDIVRTFDACKIFLYFPIYNINDGGIGSVANNQGSTMTTKGAPNDLLGNFNPLTIIVAIPILSHVIYPLLRKYKIQFGPIRRMTLGFFIATISGVIGAIVQYRVYETNPCGYYATTCASNGGGVSPISVWWQVPNYALGALSECLCNVTAYEMAYARSPKSMKSLVMSIFLFTTALSSALGEILSPAIVDPHLIWIWAGPAIALFVQTVIFWFRYKHIDNEDFMTYEEEEETSHGSTKTTGSYPDEKVAA
ncbi:MFS peptide transporter [Gloeophyllum trabeum ATCC 11539]|uniref:MFS peptide transporter n=1 Tax=Gloeophyllum trabeum (strain ATCC 11539 / FP-39264 / Madison 617) TaxID=670483 RepID=S7RXM9_GLOTA|nr:MFS peptide transporter [Gloeophyllum trabeum ATCC 11539]EPQ59685.1 MFS peptide transporter [Gloeophyllum trabeum ATCC 11539]